MLDPSKGYDTLLEERMSQILPLAKKMGVKVITNMGAANPESAIDVVCNIAQKKGLTGLKIAGVSGDDVLSKIDRFMNFKMMETDQPLYTIKDDIISANAYLGVQSMVEALHGGADVIVTGRVADPALFLAPIIYEFGWSFDDFDRLGKGTLVGHLLECAGQVTGGYFADPGKKEVPQLWNLGFPFVEVDASGQGFISKLKGTGGLVTTATCTEQLLYEIHDPRQYYTPDCIADFSKVTFTETVPDQVQFAGATGEQSTGFLKVSVGFKNGFFGEGSISYGGPNCIQRAQLAIEIIEKRLEKLHCYPKDLRFDLIGVQSILKNKMQAPVETPEVRVRVAGRTNDETSARIIANEVEALYTNGPAAGGGVSKNVEEVISIRSILIPKSEVVAQLKYLEIQ